MARVAFEKVSKVYPGRVRAVDSVDLVVEDQEFVVLVGPSGCGKSTTLRMVAGLEEITDGSITIGDRVVNEVPPKDRDVAMVFQNYALYPHMTVFNNMAFALKLRKLPKGEIREKVMQAAKILDLEHLLDRKPRALSGGQRQRVAVGRAIVREPSAFLFDEPLSNLDAKLRVTTRAEIKRLHQRLRTTTIYVTHDQEEAMTLGDRIVVMKDGRIQQADTPLRTYNHPVNRFVAGFIGMPPMNFFDGMIRPDGDELVFEEIAAAGAAKNGKPDGGGGLVGSSVSSVSQEKQLTLPPTGFRLYVPPHLRGAVRQCAGKRVVLGARPEHFHRSPPDAEGLTMELSVKLNLIEPLGNHMDLYMSTALHDHVVGRVEAESGLQIGSQMKVYLDLRKIHFFEPGETGMNLSLSNESAHALA